MSHQINNVGICCAQKAVIVEENASVVQSVQNCPVNAITGELKKVHVVNQDLCIGCGICQEKCRKDAIEMVRNGHEKLDECSACAASK